MPTNSQTINKKYYPSLLGNNANVAPHKKTRTRWHSAVRRLSSKMKHSQRALMMIIWHVGMTEAYLKSLESGLTQACHHDVLKLGKNFNNLTTWAVEMWEASAKEVTGLVRGSHYQLGNFEECLHDYDDKSYGGVERQYCLVELNLYQDSQINRAMNFDSARDVLLDNGDSSRWRKNKIFWALCSPATCTQSDLQLIMNDYQYFHKYFEQFNVSYRINVDEKFCQKDATSQPYSTGSVIFMCLTLFLSIIIVVSSIYHRHTANKKHNCPKVARAFSIFHNWRELTRKEDENLTMVNGLRVITALHIMGIHVVSFAYSGAVLNRDNLEYFYKNIVMKTTFQMTGTIVDTFFVLGGFFAIYSINKNFHDRNVLRIVASRYARLMPLCGYLIFFTSTLMVQTGDGPLWSRVHVEADYCHRNWWHNALMINNYANVEEMCYAHAWYVAADFHFYAISILLCFLLTDPKKVKYGLIVTGCLLIVSIIIPSIMIFNTRSPPMLYWDNEFSYKFRKHPFYRDIYVKSHNRMSPYILGLLTGFIYNKYSKYNSKISKIKSNILLISSAIVYFSMSYILIFNLDMNPPYEPLSSTIIGTFYRPLKSLCICIMILIFIFGDLRYITSVLGSSPMIVLGKLTYGAYLVSMMMQIRDDGLVRSSRYLNAPILIKMITWQCVMSFLISLFTYFTIEAPSNNIFKLFLKRKLRPVNQNKLPTVEEFRKKLPECF